MIDTVIGAVLAGGSSRRLGRDKALVTVGDATLLDRAISVLGRVVSRVVVSAGPETRVSTGAPVVRDLRADCGPLGALETVLAIAPGVPVFILACDLPLVDETVVRRVVSRAGDRSTSRRPRAWVARELERTQPLCGLYSPGCSGVVTASLDEGRLSFRELLERIEVAGVEVGDLGRDLLLNVNRPADLERARSVSRGR